MKSKFVATMLGLLMVFSLVIGCTSKMSKPITTLKPSETASPTENPSAPPNQFDTETPSSISASLEPFTMPAINMAAITPETYIATGNDVNVRSGPGVTYPILGALNKGTRETGIVKNGWLEFTYNGEKAYCSADYFIPDVSA